MAPLRATCRQPASAGEEVWQDLFVVWVLGRSVGFTCFKVSSRCGNSRGADMDERELFVGRRVPQNAARAGVQLLFGAGAIILRGSV